METNPKIARELLKWFLNKWDDAALRAMTLEQYVSVGDKYTFCQCVEHRTRDLGSINGFDSIKFGIFKRKNPKERKKKYLHDDVYSWRKLKNKYYDNSAEVFALVHAELLMVIEAAKAGRFEEIDKPGILIDLFKWKVAYLYSGERLISIFSRKVLENIAAHLLVNSPKKAPTSVIQAAMIAAKPSWKSIYQYANDLFQQYAPEGERKQEKSKKKGYRSRKAVEIKNTGPFSRKGSEPTIVTQKHSELQMTLKKILEDQYADGIVLMEHDFVDLKVVLQGATYLYEVKSAPYAGACVEEALGQILLYAYRHQLGQEEAAKLIVAGQYPPNKSDEEYIEYIRSKIKVDFDYQVIPLLATTVKR